MKKHVIKIAESAFVAAMLTLSACEDFLDRPTEDSFTVSDYFQNDEQCLSAVNTLYASPWNDYLRGYLNIGDILSGNYFMGADDSFQTMTVNSANPAITQASASLWDVIAHANTTIQYLEEANGSTTEAIRNQCIGECLVMKSMAYFMLVRTWGAVPIIHKTDEIVASGSSFNLEKATEANVYDYIINTLSRAMELLPKKIGNKDGRIDYYSAEGLLAKVYLQAAGVGGTLKQSVLDKAKEHAQNVIENSGRTLYPDYPDIFRYTTGAYNPEGLITLHWKVSKRWTINNWAWSDWCAAIFVGTGYGWGEWRGVTLDLQKIFNVDPTDVNSIYASAYSYMKDASKVRKVADYAIQNNSNADTRRQTTMIMYGDYYPLWWRNQGGFLATEDNAYNICNGYAGSDATTTVFSSPTGAQIGKYLFGNKEDHFAETGDYVDKMQAGIHQHLLRLSDIYLVYTEATMAASSSGASRSTSDVKYYNEVRKRAHAEEVSSVTLPELINERRRELSFEGDNWYDYVRLADYDLETAKSLIFAQNRGYYSSDLLKSVYGVEGKTGTPVLNEATLDKVITDDNGKAFRLPFPQTDVAANPNLNAKDGVEYDFSGVDYYNPDLFKNL